MPYLRRAGRVGRRYDYVVVNYKADSTGTGDRFAEEFTRPKGQRPVVLYLGDEQANLMPADTVLDQFDIILKRQPYVDLDRYPIATRNKDKIRPTTLACLVIPATKKNVRTIRLRDYGFSEPAEDYTTDVFFSGQANHPLRIQAMQTLRASNLRCSGGLQADDTRGMAPPPSLAAPKLPRPAYIDAMRGAYVNLALAGRGEFTYRHIEAWCLACFVLCSPSTRELSLPFPAQEHTHYVCYDDLDDLIAKVRYYAAASAQRRRIAAAGRRLFEHYFSFEYHARQLQYWFDHPEHNQVRPPNDAC